MAELDVIQIQMEIQSAVDEAVRNIREHALRQVMVIVNRMQSIEQTARDSWTENNAFKRGHMAARRQIYDEIETMIAKDAAT